MAYSAGEFIGDYEVLGRLGAGGMGEVYKVRHVISQRVEALKLLHDRDLDSPESRERFSREIRVLASLQHPNIAVLHTALRCGDSLAMVMEFVEGVTLSAKLRPPGLSVTQGLYYISQVLAALAFAHKHGVVHRDVKPSNMIITPDDVLKLVDFGVAVSGNDARMTASGQIVGSYHYMSPEQISGAEVDGRSDIYAVGVTLYELVTGKLPIDGPNQYAIMTGHLSRIPSPPTEVKPSIPVPLSRAVMRALEKAPEARYQGAEQMLAELKGLQVEFSGTMDDMMTVVAPAVRPSGSTGAGKTSHASSGAMLEAQPRLVEEVGKELAVYIGPIAKLIVKQAATHCSTVHELFAAIAPEIDSAKDREKFMAVRRRFVA